MLIKDDEPSYMCLQKDSILVVCRRIGKYNWNLSFRYPDSLGSWIAKWRNEKLVYIRTYPVTWHIKTLHWRNRKHKSLQSNVTNQSIRFLNKQLKISFFWLTRGMSICIFDFFYTHNSRLNRRILKFHIHCGKGFCNNKLDLPSPI